MDSSRGLRAGERQQLGWVIAIAITHILGALAYFIFGRRKNANQTTHA
ncbi:MAG: PLD nuclease N-terminal domain-containing protein [Verrucomicrobiia bacterium]